MIPYNQEWFTNVVEKVKEDPEFQDKGKGFDSLTQFKVLKDRKGKLNKDITFGMWLPTCEPCWYEEKEKDEVDIIIEGKAGTFNDVFRGKKNVVVALTMGALKLKKGSVAKLTGNLGAVNRFIKVVGETG